MVKYHKKFEKIPEPEKRALKKSMRSFVQRKVFPEVKKMKDMAIGQSLEVYVLPHTAISELKAISDSERSAFIEKIQENHQPQYFHPIHVNGESVAFGISFAEKGKPEKPSLGSLCVSPLPKIVESELSRVKEDNRLVRLLMVPSHRITALWLINEADDSSDVRIIDCPKAIDKVKYNENPDLSEFLNILSGDYPIFGIAADTQDSVNANG